MPIDDDRALLERCLAHERAAWDAFVERFSRLIYSVVHHTLARHGARRDEDRVDELFHAAFFALYDRNYRKLRQWSGRCSLASWVRLVTTTTVVDALRRRRPDRSLDEDPDATPVDLLIEPRTPEQQLQRVERAARMRDALATLSESDRALLLGLYHDELGPGELADRMGIGAGALYTRKNRALGRLRAAYERLDDDV